jgi:two-component system, LytTR family, response regulator LytT
MALKIVIIEDEELSAQDLKSTLLKIDTSIEIAAMLDSVKACEAYFANNPIIDLIFSDIELGDGQSFDVFEKINSTTPIIFCTAYNQYALKAFETAGIDYILKPFSKQTVEKALTKYKNLRPHENTLEPNNLNQLLDQLRKELNHNKLPNILTYLQDKIIPIEGDQIALFYIEHNLVKALTFQGKTIHTNYKLDELEKSFTPYFFRANRQFLVNKKAIKEASQHFHRKLQIHLSVLFPQEILVGKEKASAFLQWLSN